jgi:hypothetical protein
MDQQGNAENAGPGGKKKGSVDPDGQIGMQGVEANTAAIRVENRICQQVIQIDQQAGQQNQYRL